MITFSCSRIFPDKEAMISGSIEMAKLIAEKSPVAVQGSKNILVHSRDHSVAEGLLHTVSWKVVFTINTVCVGYVIRYKLRKIRKNSCCSQLYTIDTYANIIGYELGRTI